MNGLIFAAALAFTTPSLTLAQTNPAVAAPAQAPVTSPAPAPVVGNGAAATGIPLIAPATESADCGKLLASPAYCVTAELTQIGTLADAYIESLQGSGWLAADGDDNRVIFVRRRDGGVCDGLQMIAFYDQAAPVTPTTMGYLGFAMIAGNICQAAPQGASSQ